MFPHFLSIAQHHMDKGETEVKWVDGEPWMDDEIWNRTKTYVDSVMEGTYRD